MAVDTKEKRLSILNLGLPWWTTLPEPGGAIDEGDRLHLLHLYSGIEAAAPITGTVSTYLTVIGTSIESFSVVGADTRSFSVIGLDSQSLDVTSA